jgi:hypothetical protein
MSYLQREIVTALHQWGTGKLPLTDEQREQVLAALVEVVRVLDGAPSGSNGVATGVWFNHERSPALARLSDALHPHHQGAALQRHAERLQSDHELITALQQALARGR